MMMDLGVSGAIWSRHIEYNKDVEKNERVVHEIEYNEDIKNKVLVYLISTCNELDANDLS